LFGFYLFNDNANGLYVTDSQQYNHKDCRFDMIKLFYQDKMTHRGVFNLLRINANQYLKYYSKKEFQNGSGVLCKVFAQRY